MPSVLSASVCSDSVRDAQLRVVRDRAERRIGTDRRVEHRQAARIDRIEADVGAIGLAEEIPEHAVVIDHRQLGAILLALGPIRRAVAAVVDPRRQAAARPDADRRRRARNRILPVAIGSLRSFVMIGSGRNSFQPSDTVITAVRPSRIAPMWRIRSSKAVQDQALAPAIDHLLRQVRRDRLHFRHRREALRVQLLALVEHDRRRAGPRPSPRRNPSSITLVRRPNVICDGLIVGVMTPTRSSAPMIRVINSISGSLMRVRALDADVLGVEIQHEHAAARIGRELVGRA